MTFKPARKLGRRPHDPARPVLKLKHILSGKLPDVPKSANYLKGKRFTLGANDKYGDCGPVFVANDRILVTSQLTPDKVHVPSLADILALYKTQNPTFDPNDPGGPGDQGVEMAAMLDAVHKVGIGGVKCLAYAQVDVNDPVELAAAIAIFGGVGFGVTLDDAQEAQTDKGTWDYVAGSDLWGGHAVLAGAEGPIKVVTWAQGVTCTPAFLQHQLDEAWVVIWPEHLTDHGFLQGVDLRALADAYETLTGKKFPAVVPPAPPAPTPVPPTPVPVPPAPPAPTPVPPAPSPHMVLSGYCSTPFGKWPVVLTDGKSVGVPVSGFWSDAAAFAKDLVINLYHKEKDVVLPVLLADIPKIVAGDWEAVLKDVAKAIADKGI